MSSMEANAEDILLEESANNFDAVATLMGSMENIITSMFLVLLESKRPLPKSTRTSLLKSLAIRVWQSIVTPKRIVWAPLCTLFAGATMHSFRPTERACRKQPDWNLAVSKFKEDLNKTNPISSLWIEIRRRGVWSLPLFEDGKAIFPNGDDRLMVGDWIISDHLDSKCH